MLGREAVESIRKRYPKGTKIKLHEMEGEKQMPAGLLGEVTCVDDIGQIHVNWINGSTLAVHPIKDRYKILSEAEYDEEMTEQKFLEKVRLLLRETDLKKLHVSCNSNDNVYAAEMMLKLQCAFEEVYGQGAVDKSNGIITLPGIIKCRKTGIHEVALLLIDLESSGEHWGITFFSEHGVLPLRPLGVNIELQSYIMENYIPYDYWYFCPMERDICGNIDEMPKSISSIFRLVFEYLEQNEAPLMDGPV